MPIADPYKAALREALVGAVETKLTRDRRRAVARRAVLALVLLAALVAAAVTIALPNDRADASIDVEVRDGLVFVRLLDLENRPDEIVGALRNAGIDAVVEAVPVGPSNVGRFVGSETTQGGPIDIVQDSRFSFASFSVPQDFEGVLQLSLGREAASGEPWASFSDATAKGEAFACRAVRGRTPAEATDLVTKGSATVSWYAFSVGALEPGAELRPPYASWRVVEALSTSAGLVVLSLTADGSWPLPTEAPSPVDPSCKGN